MIKKLTLEKYLYLKGYTTKGTSYHKIKTNKGIAKAFIELFFNNLKSGNVLELQNLVNEFRDLSK
jgi:hypothetical protein